MNYEEKFNKEVRDLKLTFKQIENQISNLSSDINRARPDGKSVHYMANIRQQLHFAQDELKTFELFKEFKLKYIQATTNVFRSHSIVHSLSNEYFYNDGVIDESEKNILEHAIDDHIQDVVEFKKVLLEFADVCAKTDNALIEELS